MQCVEGPLHCRYRSTFMYQYPECLGPLLAGALNQWDGLLLNLQIGVYAPEW